MHEDNELLFNKVVNDAFMYKLCYTFNNVVSAKVMYVLSAMGCDSPHILQLLDIRVGLMFMLILIVDE